jgi:hypothetical protein
MENDMQAVTKLGRWLTVERDKVGFKRDAVGWVLVVLSALSALNGAFVFLGVLKTGIVGWLMLNTCAPSIALFVIGFALGNPVVMVAGSVLMFRYGTGGLFVFGWSGYDIPGQIGHILMTLSVIYTTVHMVRGRRWRALGLGVLLGLAILIPLMIVQTGWLNAHPEMMEMLFSGNWEMPSQ